MISLLLVNVLFAQNNQGEATQSAKKINDCKGTIQDYDGNTYNVVQIGDQCWTKENLKTTHFSDGTAIPLGETADSKTAYRYYPNSYSEHVATYGYLYNWPAIMHNAPASADYYVPGVCPKGWHVPYFTEWYQLAMYVIDHNPTAHAGNSKYVDMNVVSIGLSSKFLWNVERGGGFTLNYTGFSAIPAGCLYNGNYFHMGALAYFWSIVDDDLSPNYMSVPGGLMDPEGVATPKDFGISVRCLRNE